MSEKLNLWRCGVIWKCSVVLASADEPTEDDIMEAAADEIRNTGGWTKGDADTPRQIMDRLNIPYGWAKALPYGGDDRTCEQIMRGARGAERPVQK